jgi:hypothetical protein
MLDSEIKDFKIKKGKLKICEKILFKIITIFGQRNICFIFKEKTENNTNFIFSKLKENLKSTLNYENINAIYDKPKDDFQSHSVINLFFNIQDTDFETLDKPCIIFAVRIFLLD